MRAFSLIFFSFMVIGVNSTLGLLRRMRSGNGGNFAGVGDSAGAGIINASPVNTNVDDSISANGGASPSPGDGGYNRGYLAGKNAYMNNMRVSSNSNTNASANLNMNPNSPASLNLNLNSILGGNPKGNISLTGNVGNGNININGNSKASLSLSGSPGNAYVTINGVNVPLSGFNFNVNSLNGGNSSSSAAAAAGPGSAAAALAFPGNSGSIDLGSRPGSNNNSSVGSTQNEVLLGLKRY